MSDMPSTRPQAPQVFRPLQKHRFWKIHLSTAVVLIIGLGFLIALNILPHSSPSTIPFLSEKCYGWPRDFLFVRFEYTKIEPPDNFILNEGGTGFSTWHGNQLLPLPDFDMFADQKAHAMDPVIDQLGTRLHSCGKVDKPFLIVDTIFALAVLFSLGFPLEYLIRRREARKQ